MTKNQRNFLLDVILLGLALFLIPELPFVTLAAHEVMSWVIGGVVAVHIGLHWKWVVSITRRVFTSWSALPVRTRTEYVLNGAMLIMFVLAFITGVMVSVHRDTDPATAPVDLHHLTANLAILLLVIHIVRHWKWLWSMIQKSIIKHHTSKQTA